MSEEMTWDDKIAYYRSEVKKIRLPQYPTESEVKQKSAQIDELYTSAIFDHGEAQSEFYKVDNLISRVEADNKRGNNDDERKANAVRAAQNFRDSEGNLFNLYGAREKAYERKVKMEQVIKALSNKQRLLTLLYGTLKMETDMNRFQ